MTMVKKYRRRTRVSAKHQITIPIDALKEAGLRAGDRLEVVAVGPGTLTITRTDDPVTRFAGTLTDVYTTGQADKLRDEWE